MICTWKITRVKLLKVTQNNIKLLCRQGIELRGNSETDCNFMQLLQIHAIDEPDIHRMLQKKLENIQIFKSKMK